MYDVTSVEGFVDEWVNCYSRLGYRVELHAHTGDGFTYIDR